MFVFTADEMARITQATFLDRLYGFLFQRARSGSVRAVLADRASVMSLWNALWPNVAASSEHDAAVFLSFWLVALRVEGLDELEIRRGLDAPEGQAPYAMDAAVEMRIKRFLETRGHLGFSEFDLPAHADEADPGASPGSVR